MMMILPIPLLLQGAEWLIVLVVAVPLVVVGLVIYVIVKLGLAGAGALDRYGKANASPRGYPSSGTAAGFCAACGAPMAPGSKFCPNCGRQV